MDTTSGLYCDNPPERMRGSLVGSLGSGCFDAAEEKSHTPAFIHTTPHPEVQTVVGRARRVRIMLATSLSSGEKWPAGVVFLSHPGLCFPFRVILS